MAKKTWQCAELLPKTPHVYLYLDAMGHPDFWDRLAAYLIEHGWPAPSHGTINLYPEIARDDKGWEIAA